MFISLAAAALHADLAPRHYRNSATSACKRRRWRDVLRLRQVVTGALARHGHPADGHRPPPADHRLVVAGHLDVRPAGFGARGTGLLSSTTIGRTSRRNQTSALRSPTGDSSRVRLPPKSSRRSDTQVRHPRQVRHAVARPQLPGGGSPPRCDRESGPRHPIRRVRRCTEAPVSSGHLSTAKPLKPRNGFRHSAHGSPDTRLFQQTRHL